MTPWVAGLMGVNALVFLMTMGNPGLYRDFALVPGLLTVRPWTAVTYMFLHANMAHIFFNMLSLYFFGPMVEARIGGRHFAFLYFVSGITGAVLSLGTPAAAIVGASGAVNGVMLGFAWFWPRQPIMIWGVVPVEARWLIVIFTLISLFGASGGGGGIAHFAHLGGYVGAYVYLKLLGERAVRAAAAWKKQTAPRVPGGGNPIERWKKINAAALHPVNREEYDRVMKKLDADGSGSLTAGEREFLDRFSQVVN